MKPFARFISLITNPFLLFITIPYIVVYRESQNSTYSLKWAGLTLLFLGLVGLFVLIGVKKKIFSDFDVSNQKQRAILFLFAGVVTFLFLKLAIFLQGPRILLIATLSAILGILLASIINLKIKASIHVATITSYILSLAFLYHGAFFFGLLLIPVVAWSRIVIKRHTLQETIVGSILGATLTIGMYSIVKYIF